MCNPKWEKKLFISFNLSFIFVFFFHSCFYFSIINFFLFIYCHLFLKIYFFPCLFILSFMFVYVFNTICKILNTGFVADHYSFSIIIQFTHVCFFIHSCLFTLFARSLKPGFVAVIISLRLNVP